MTIGFSPFLTADVDETRGRVPRAATTGGPESGDVLAVRLELIRRRVLEGYYSSNEMASAVARRLIRRETFRDC